MKNWLGVFLLFATVAAADTTVTHTRWMLVEGVDGPRVVRYHKGIWKRAYLREEARPDGTRSFNWATQEGPGDYRIHSSVPAEMGFELTGQLRLKQNPPHELFVVRERPAEY